MICVQSEATAPLVGAFERGDDDTAAVTAGQTLAVGLNVPGGVGHFRVLQNIRASQGAAIAVSEADIAAEFARLSPDRKSVGEEKAGSVGCDLGCRRHLKKKT